MYIIVVYFIVSYININKCIYLFKNIQISTIILSSKSYHIIHNYHNI